MTNFITFVQSYLATRTERGAGLAEYALLLFLIALASITILGTLGGTIANVFTQINNGLN